MLELRGRCDLAKLFRKYEDFCKTLTHCLPSEINQTFEIFLLVLFLTDDSVYGNISTCRRCGEEFIAGRSNGSERIWRNPLDVGHDKYFPGQWTTLNLCPRFEHSCGFRSEPPREREESPRPEVGDDLLRIRPRAATSQLIHYYPLFFSLSRVCVYKFLSPFCRLRNIDSV